jgi:hypothetical protein
MVEGIDHKSNSNNKFLDAFFHFSTNDTSARSKQTRRINCAEPVDLIE